jgi:hypothetical protein
VSQHIQQRGYADCGVACIAMAAGVEYERVLASVAPDCREYGLYWGEVLHALKKITKKEWKHKEFSSVYFRDLDRPNRPVILYVERTGGFDSEIIRTHYIYITGTYGLTDFRDPTRPEAEQFNLMKNSEIGNWKVLAAIYEE